MQIRNVTQTANFASARRISNIKQNPIQKNIISNTNPMKTRSRFIPFIAALAAILSVGSCIARAQQPKPPANEAISVMSEYLDYKDVPAVERPDF